MSNDQKPRHCPFCGSDDITPVLWKSDEHIHRLIQMQCRKCGARGPVSVIFDRGADASHYPEAVAAWNRYARRAMPRDDKPLQYRYDGVDEDEQHWLEVLENGMPTEKYVPIVLWKREE